MLHNIRVVRRGFCNTVNKPIVSNVNGMTLRRFEQKDDSLRPIAVIVGECEELICMY